MRVLLGPGECLAPIVRTQLVLWSGCPLDIRILEVCCCNEFTAWCGIAVEALRCPRTSCVKSLRDLKVRLRDRTCRYYRDRCWGYRGRSRRRACAATAAAATTGRDRCGQHRDAHSSWVNVARHKSPLRVFSARYALAWHHANRTAHTPKKHRSRCEMNRADREGRSDLRHMDRRR